METIIVHITPFFYPSIGGVEKSIEILSMESVKKGYDVHIITSYIDNFGNRIQRPSFEYYHKIAIHRTNHLIKYGFGVLLNNLCKIIKKIEPKFIHVHVYRHPHTLQVIGKISRNYITILNTHAPFPPPSEVPITYNFYYSIFDKFVSPLYLLMFKSIITLTEYDKKQIIKRGAPLNRVITIPNPISHVYYENCTCKNMVIRENINLENYKDEFIILYTGRITYQKNLETIIYSISMLNLDMKKKSIVIFSGPGDEKYISKLKNIARKFNVKLVFTGPLNELELLYLYKNSTIFILPSFYEAFSLSLVEAMASGLPVLSLARGGPEYILGNKLKKYCFINNYDINKLTYRIKKLLLNEELRENISRLCQERAQMFNPKNIMNRYEKLYIFLE
jgi:glycosyltransferase involved in cell wall biosynthesis